MLLPTEMMLAHDRAWLVTHYAPLTVLYPELDYGLIMRRDPDFQLTQRRVAQTFSNVGMKIMMSVPETMLFFNRVGGHMVRSVLLRKAMDDPDTMHVAVPYAEIGDRFGVSRTHVRQLLVAAEEAGLVKLHARGGHLVELLPRLWTTYDLGIAGGMFLHDMIYQAATRQFVSMPGGS